VQRVSPLDLQGRLAAGEDITIVDVRESGELEICSLPAVVHIPLGELSGRHTELDPDHCYALLCHHGIRSARAVGFLMQQGFQHVINIEGGIERWTDDVDPTLRRY